MTTAIALFIATSTFASAPISVSTTMKQFNTDYPVATLLNWSETNNHYVIGFIDNGIINRLFVNKKNGKTYAHVRYYKAKDLNSDIKDQLHYFLPSARIQGVTEVNMDGQTGYVVNMVRKDYLYIVNVDENQNITVTNEFHI